MNRMKRQQAEFSLCVLAAVAVVALRIPAASHAQDKRLPVPDRAAQQRAVERIKAVFPDEFDSKRRDVQIELAKQLL